ncbi:MAG: hypothetical protein JEZ09_21010, partial [Salinivirgaceae bacterium]|nr:hypothetical protein [Salinivirgaceae bacterium]
MENVADRESNIAIRFTTGPTGAYSYSGWNIDNVSLTGTFIEDDTGFLSLVSPSSGCGHTGPEPLEIQIKNYGYSPTIDTVPIGYSINGGASWVMDTLFEVIPKDETRTIVFSEFIDLSEPGFHSVSIKTFY